MNPRRISAEELELIALRWARSQPGRILNNINVDCFIAGFKAAHDVLYYNFGDFLIDEGQYFQYEYPKKRIDSCALSGIPLVKGHGEEFENAREFESSLKNSGECSMKPSYYHNTLLP